MNKILTIFLVILFNFSLQAKNVPTRAAPIVDQAGLLSRNVSNALSNALFQIKKQTGNEISVLTVKSLEDETVDSYSIKVADQWKLGDKEKDNGVLLLIALEDRKMRIEVGQGLEGKLPDIVAGRIIRSMTPYFKKGDYKSGIIIALSQIVDKTGGELTNTPKVRNRRSKKSFSSIILIIFIILSIFSGKGRRGGGRGLLLGLLVGGALGGRRSSYGGGGFSSGGGSFGGGGGFSGGGASGGW